MSDIKAQEFYQLYRNKTLESGHYPIGRQRFTGIIKTLSLIPETLDYIQDKANEANTGDSNCNIPHVMPRYCFVCGSKLEVQDSSWMQCENDKFEVSRTVKIPDGANVFDFPVQNRIVNLWHNYFILDRGQDVHPKVYFQYNDFRLVTGKTLLEPSVVSYFAEKYPQSSWFKEK